MRFAAKFVEMVLVSSNLQILNHHCSQLPNLVRITAAGKLTHLTGK